MVGKASICPMSGAQSPLIGVAALRLLLIVSVCLLCTPKSAAAQVVDRKWSFTVAAGLAGQALRPEGVAPIGGHAAAMVSARITSRFVLRVEGLTTNFGEWASDHQAPCPPDTPPAACGSQSAAIRLRALTIGLGGGGRGERRYAMIGGGAYHLSAHPTAKGDTRAGFYAAYGRPLTAVHPTLMLEAQLHWVPGLSHGGEWSLPLRLGLAF